MHFGTFLKLRMIHSARLSVFKQGAQISARMVLACRQPTVTLGVRSSATHKDTASSFQWKTPQFDNSEMIYKSKTLSELLRAYVVFTACSFDVLVDNQAKVCSDYL